MPPRGRWDRTASTVDRAAARRRAVAAAAARAVFDRGRHVTVSDVIERAHVGRNTFYALFDDLPAAIRSAEVDALAEISNVFVPSPDSRTPIERLRTLISSWFALAVAEPHL